MRIVLNGWHLNLQEGDEISVYHHPCGTCGAHAEITVCRNGERVAHFGDEVSIFQGKEVFGDVVIPREK